ncbi:MAG: M10 family metallopeptidase C-terminal domain-containing protein [Pseudomonadota bacterium]
MCQICRAIDPLSAPAQTDALHHELFDTAPPASVGLTQLTSPLDALDWGISVASSLNVYFVPGNLTVSESPFTGPDITTSGWSATDIAQAMDAFSTFSDIANLNFSQVHSPAQADFLMIGTAGIGGALGYWAVGGGSVHISGGGAGIDGYYSNSGWGVFNTSAASWTPAGLTEGGYGYVTLLHEIGHGLGLAHPHDTGGSSSVMSGVTQPFWDYGDGDLNQGIYTTMSYNGGWQTSPHGTPPSLASYGWQSTPGALDIALLQDKYGARAHHNVGTSQYVLPGANVLGTGYKTIWDTSGTDGISYDGFKDAVIDLQSVTISHNAVGGPPVSYVKGVHGGLLIAEDVVIEDGKGGEGDDQITGNAADNTLTGRGGEDNLTGGEGNDTLLGGDGRDTLNGDAGTDHLTGGAGADSLYGDDGEDTLLGGLGADLMFGGDDDDYLDGEGWSDQVYGGFGNDTLRGGGDGDYLYGERGADHLMGGSGHDVMDGGDDNDTLMGEQGADNLYGGDGNDDLHGGFQADTLRGGTGHDTLDGASGADSLEGEDGDDQLHGGSQDDTLDGGADDDQLFGGAEHDLLRGGDGHDTLDGEDGRDTLHGGEGDDRLIGNGRDDHLNGDAGQDTLLGGFGNDDLRGGDDDDQLFGGTGADTMAGEDGHDDLRGASGNDQMAGGLGDDWLRGQAGDDILTGGAGRDTLDGGAGNDALTGGSGTTDIFVFADGHGHDTISDIETLDGVNLSAITVMAKFNDIAEIETGRVAGRPALVDLGDDLRVETGVNSSITFLDTDWVTLSDMTFVFA